MAALIAASAFFVAIHLMISATGLRSVLVAAMGDRVYQAVYSVASLGGIIAMAMSYNAAAAAGSELLIDLGPGVRHLGVLIMPVAFVLGVTGLLTRNPTSMGFEDAVDDPNVVRGILRITRHPFQWSVSIFSLFHLLANGDAASLVFFGAFFIVSFAGTFSLDAKRARAMGSRWTGFASKTSNFPFAAILAGRQQLSLSEIGLVKPLVGLLVFAAIAASHAWLFGVSPFPGGWTPF
jgi:uncharacterized membrane protein